MVMVVHAAFATLLAAAPRFAGGLGQTRLSTIRVRSGLKRCHFRGQWQPPLAAARPHVFRHKLPQRQVKGICGEKHAWELGEKGGAILAAKVVPLLTAIDTAWTFPCRTLHPFPRGNGRMTQGRIGYALPEFVRLFHPLLSSGFYRRFP